MKLTDRRRRQEESPVSCSELTVAAEGDGVMMVMIMTMTIGGNSRLVAVSF